MCVQHLFECPICRLFSDLSTCVDLFRVSLKEWLLLKSANCQCKSAHAHTAVSYECFCRIFHSKLALLRNKHNESWQIYEECFARKLVHSAYSFSCMMCMGYHRYELIRSLCVLRTFTVVIQYDLVHIPTKYEATGVQNVFISCQSWTLAKQNTRNPSIFFISEGG